MLNAKSPAPLRAMPLPPPPPPAEGERAVCRARPWSASPPGGGTRLRAPMSGRGRRAPGWAGGRGRTRSGSGCLGGEEGAVLNAGDMRAGGNCSAGGKWRRGHSVVAFVWLGEVYE